MGKNQAGEIQHGRVRSRQRVSQAGQPLCRLGYRGEKDDWDFAIYRYSRGSYDPNVLFMPAHDSVRRCLSGAMHAYSIIG